MANSQEKKRRKQNQLSRVIEKLWLANEDYNITMINTFKKMDKNMS